MDTPYFDLLPSPSATDRTMTYAGVGARETPPDILALMARAAVRLEQRGYRLQTGDAKGADAAFRGAVSNKIVFTARDATERVRLIAKEIHPAPGRLWNKALDLMARNTFQVFGADLQTPVDFVLCWTPDGCTSHSSRSPATGGTGQAISLASLKGIPVFNLHNPGWANQLAAFLDGA